MKKKQQSNLPSKRKVLDEMEDEYQSWCKQYLGKRQQTKSTEKEFLDYLERNGEVIPNELRD